MLVRVVLAGDLLADAGACLAASLPVGDPTRVRHAARRSAALGAELRQVSSQLLVASGSVLWRGAAGSAFVEAMSHAAPRVGATADRYDAYGSALDTYATALDAAVTELPRLVREISWLRDVLVAVRATPVEDSAGGAALLRRADLLENELRPLVRQFVLTQAEWADAVDACAAALLRANDSDPTRDLHGWDAVRHNVGHAVGGAVHPFVEFVEHPSLQALSDACGALASDLAVLGLAFMVVFPPAAAICFTAATIMSAAKLGTDLGRVANGEGVGAGALLGDVIDSLPAGRGLRVGVHEAERAIPHGFASAEEFSSFSSKINSGLHEAGHPEARAAIQGSAVTGKKFTTGAPFDVGRRSDFDVALSGERLFNAAKDAGVQLRSRKSRTAPLDDDQLDELGLLALRDNLSDFADREVGFMVFRSDSDVVTRPTIWIPKP